MTKKKKLEDKLLEKLEDMLKDLSIKDMIWILTWSTTVATAYVTVEFLAEPIRDILLRPFGMLLWLMENWLFKDVVEEDPNKPIINYYSLGIAMATAWIIMNTDIDDITEAIGTVRTLLAKREM